MDGTPGVDADHTRAYHWTKVRAARRAASINSQQRHASAYDYGKNHVYRLYDCAAEFMEGLEDETVTYEYTDDTYHTKSRPPAGSVLLLSATAPSYEGNRLCSGAATAMESSPFGPEICKSGALWRWRAAAYCDYAVRPATPRAKAVDCQLLRLRGRAAPHRLTVSDLSDDPASPAQIRYGHSADSCTLTSAPSYTEAGSYPIYYEITYTYKDTDMTENGVAYVHLLDESTGDCACGCGNPDCACDGDCGGDCCSDDSCGDNHNWVLLNSVDASCLTLGYDRYICVDCGRTENATTPRSLATPTRASSSVTPPAKQTARCWKSVNAAAM